MAVKHITVFYFKIMILNAKLVLCCLCLKVNMKNVLWCDSNIGDSANVNIS